MTRRSSERRAREEKQIYVKRERESEREGACLVLMSANRGAQRRGERLGEGGREREIKREEEREIESARSRERER